MADIYTVISQVQTQVLNDQQHLVDVVSVDFVSTDGLVTGNVTVPLTPDYGTQADMAIRDYLAQAAILA